MSAVLGGWTPGYASYTKIRDNFDVKEPYPQPYPAPNSTLPFAKKLPQDKVVAADQPIVLPLPELSLPKELPDASSMPPPPLPVPSKPKLASKKDPYEEEEVAVASLLDPSLASPSPVPPSRNSYTHHRIKEEMPSPSGSSYRGTSGDVKPRIKAEEMDESAGEDYQPSEEWAKAFASLQQQPEEEEDEQKELLSDDYLPSEDLLKALSSLPEGMVEMGSSSSSSSATQPKIKAEPRDDDFLPPSSLPPYFSERNMRERSMTLKEDENSTLARKKNEIGVKREWSDDHSPGTFKRVKLEK